MKQILVFVLFAGILCWAMFAPVYKHVLMVRNAVLQQEVDYLLEMGANGAHGYIDNAAIAASRIRLEQKGFTPSLLQYEVGTTSGVDGANPVRPVRRGVGLQLRISYPYERLFELDRLIGVTPPVAGARMAASGVKMSEYVP
ncbi:hypothetical protein [Paenibacillus koleovorans]|uniref:hypothetical protein n=1 Tax=Paenibacillus koleovorans TaxID=121608 RepID=UPI000FDA8ABF|nr:hypothetical protein [Paenibacillus koleovorans]